MLRDHFFLDQPARIPVETPRDVCGTIQPAHEGSGNAAPSSPREEHQKPEEHRIYGEDLLD